MGKITFILGGAKSGKSSYALTIVQKKKQKVAFIATCQALDNEMKQRIEIHKKSRPAGWQTVEEPYDMVAALNKIERGTGCVIIDCLTLLVSNLLLSGKKRSNIETQVTKMLAHLRKMKSDSVIISNEVGLGIVPLNKTARDFRDAAGAVNQIVAKSCDKVFFMVSGMPLKVK